jgi:lysophosphatidate acyltransferase
VLDPIPTTDLTSADVDDLCNKTREIMLKEIINLTYQSRGQEAPIAASTVKASGVDLKH